MMFRTATVQVNLDFADEKDMIAKMRVGLALQPIATALFANSPFERGKPNGYKSYRAEIWRDTDPDRTGLLPFVFEEGMGFERYVDYALDVPMYFVYRNGRYIDVAGSSFRDFLQGKLAQLPGVRPTFDDWADHLTTLFPDVRLKRFLEMRGADASSTLMGLASLPAFWAGLLYDSAALGEASALVADWSLEELKSLRDSVPRLGLDAPFHGDKVLRFAREAVAIAERGLMRRAMICASGEDERMYLAPLLATAQEGRAPADRLLTQYHGDWDGDIDRLFDASAF
jgi:glutamate--cysteine ligase